MSVVVIGWVGTATRRFVLVRAERGNFRARSGRWVGHVLRAIRLGIGARRLRLDSSPALERTAPAPWRKDLRPSLSEGEQSRANLPLVLLPRILHGQR